MVRKVDSSWQWSEACLRCGVRRKVDQLLICHCGPYAEDVEEHGFTHTTTVDGVYEGWRDSRQQPLLVERTT